MGQHAPTYDADLIGHERPSCVKTGETKEHHNGLFAASDLGGAVVRYGFLWRPFRAPGFAFPGVARSSGRLFALTKRDAIICMFHGLVRGRTGRATVPVL
jgi:hypothetical protein